MYYSHIILKLARIHARWDIKRMSRYFGLVNYKRFIREIITAEIITAEMVQLKILADDQIEDMRKGLIEIEDKIKGNE